MGDSERATARGGYSHMKVPSLPFDGKEEAWTAWKLRFTSWMKLIGVYDVMAGIIEQPSTTDANASADYHVKNNTAPRPTSSSNDHRPMSALPPSAPLLKQLRTTGMPRRHGSYASTGTRPRRTPIVSVVPGTVLCLSPIPQAAAAMSVSSSTGIAVRGGL
jgi:hypothetical protein